jgi:hypothetical protein
MDKKVNTLNVGNSRQLDAVNTLAANAYTKRSTPSGTVKVVMAKYFAIKDAINHTHHPSKAVMAKYFAIKDATKHTHHPSTRI